MVGFLFLGILNLGSMVGFLFELGQHGFRLSISILTLGQRCRLSIYKQHGRLSIRF